MTSHKPLKSISHNFGHSIIGLMNYVGDDYFLGHLLKQARMVNTNRLEVDILKNTANPNELLTDTIRNRITHWNNWFPDLVKSSGSSMDFIHSATMVIEFDLQQTRPFANDLRYTENPFTCEIRIVDDRGKEFTHKHTGWWFPES